MFKIVDGRLELPERLTFETFKDFAFRSFSLPKRFVVDATSVRSCDSVGLAALLWLLREALKQNSEISWQNLHGTLLLQLKLYNLYQEGLIYG